MVYGELLSPVNTANDVVIDSMMPIGAKTVQVAAASKATTDTDFPKIHDLVKVGGKVGLIDDTPRQGEDGAWYATVDVWAQIRLGGVTGTFTDGQPVYLTGAGAITGTATGNSCIGYADRPKSAGAAGNLWVQLIPSATGA